MFLRASKFLAQASIAAATLAVSMGFGQLAEAGNRTTVLVMAEDATPDSMDRDSQIVARIHDAMSNQMNQMGFEVYDENATTMETSSRHKRKYFTKAELIDIVRHNVTRPGTNRPITIRAAAVFETFLAVRDKGYTQQFRLRIAGRLVDPQSGRSLGNFEIMDPAGSIRLNASCDTRACIQELGGDHGRELGEALGYELARMLDYDRGGDGDGASTTGSASGEEIYSIIFRNVNDDEFALVEEYLVDYFSGYLDHDIDKAIGKTHYVTYRSTIKASKLKRNLNRVFDELDWKGRVTNSGNDYTFEKLSLRKKASKGKDGW